MANLAKIFRNNVRQRLADLDITQAELAKRLKVTTAQIAQYLSDDLDRNPSIEVLGKYAAALDVSCSWLLGENTNQTVTREPTDDEFFAAFAKRMIKDKKRLTAILGTLTVDDDDLDFILDIVSDDTGDETDSGSSAK